MILSTHQWHDTSMFEEQLICWTGTDWRNPSHAAEVAVMEKTGYGTRKLGSRCADGVP